MSGKIYKESMNLYQDQARILFNYYRRAAEKIVKEETDLEKSIAIAKEEIEQAKKNKKKGLILIIVLGILGVFGAIFGIIIFFRAKKSIKENEEKIIAFEEAHRDIRRNFSVKKMGVVYVPVATKVPFEGKSFIVDHTGQVSNKDFKMSVVHKPEELLESLTSLDGTIKEIPFVEQTTATEEIDTSDYSTSIQRIKLYDYTGNIDRQVRNIRYLLNDNDTVSLSLPIVMPESKDAEFIKEFATSDTGDKPVVPVFNVDNFKEKLESFYALNDMRKSFERSTNENQVIYFKKLIGRLAESVHILSKTKIKSSGKIVDYSNMIFCTVLKASFNHYSPALEAEEIERIRLASFDYQESVDDYTPFSLKSSSRVKYDLFSTSWVAEDQSRTAMPFGMHQIQEEVLAPVIQNLMTENRIERLKIYNNIKDQKIDYLNQWHRDTEDFYGRNRAEAADIINRMREAYANYVRCMNTYKALQETQMDMQRNRSLDASEVQKKNNEAEMIAGFELQAQQFQQKQDEFTSYMDRLKENIDEKAAKFGYIPYYEATLRDKESRDIAQSTDQLQEMEPRRKKLIVASPYIAKYAKLPPMPNVEQKMYDDFDIDLLKEAAKAETISEENESPPVEEAEETTPQEPVVEESVAEETIAEEETVVENDADDSEDDKSEDDADSYSENEEDEDYEDEDENVDDEEDEEYEEDDDEEGDK